MKTIVGNKRNMELRLVDLVPAISGLIGKIALVSSFALVWAKELGITHPNFVLENVRIEILIGSIITLIGALLYANAAPAGTLAPLVVLVPAMATFGVHPLILGVLVGLIGMIAVKTGLFNKLVELAGFVTKTSITLTFGISGLIMSAKKLVLYFEEEQVASYTIIILLSIIYVVLFRVKKNWLIIPVAAVVSFLVPLVLGTGIQISMVHTKLNLNPFYWWNEMWGLGFGLDLDTILKTIPFALFVILLWTIDTVSIQTIQESNASTEEEKINMDIPQSFLIVSIRNIVGSIFGGAQTGSLWRSFLIPLFMMKRPIRACAIVLGITGIIGSLTLVPIQIMSYVPLVWSVLLFGIFMPFTVTAVQNILKTEKSETKIIVVLCSIVGIIVSPIFTWITSVFYERIVLRTKEK